MMMSNRIRDRKYGTAESREGEVLDGVRLGMHDLTELENPDFRYVL
jgi:MFS transporter, ACS family, allantoate permease